MEHPFKSKTRKDLADENASLHGSILGQSRKRTALIFDGELVYNFNGLLESLSNE
jgi:hypothetical protein